MNSQRIESLIAQFERGETSLEEELELKVFFAREDVPPHLAVYKDLFAFYQEALREEIPDPDFDARIFGVIDENNPEQKAHGRFRKLFPALSIAAALILMVGFYTLFLNQRSSRDTFNDPAMAYAETKRIMVMVSGNLNAGTEKLVNLKAINSGKEELNTIKALDEGMKTMRKISILDKTKEIITQKSN